MKTGILIKSLLLGAILTMTSSVALCQTNTASSQLGVNISPVCDWCGDSTFVDLMKQARGFASVSAPWDPVNSPAQVDANGWPTQDFGVVFTSWMGDPAGQPLTTTNPSFFGTYTLSFTGQANLSSNGSKQIINQVYNAQTNTTTAQLIVGPTIGQIDLEFSNTQRTPGSGVNTGLQNIQLLRPGYALGSTQVFTTQFLQALAPFSTIRVMEFLQTNGSPVKSWTQRTPPSMPSQQLNTTGGIGSKAINSGVAWEYVIQLANLTGKDIWINIPDGVDLTDTTNNNYVTQLAKLLKANLNPGIHVYVEYSNETWNGQFSQTSANIASAQTDVSSGADTSLNFDNINNIWYWGFRHALHQTVRISQLFAAVYGQAAINTTIRPVYMSQYGQPYIIEDSLNYLQQNFGAPKNYIYAVGGAPYFNLPNSYTDVNSFFTSLIAGANQVLPGFSGQPAFSGLFPVYSGITYQNIADYYGLKNLSYEGGPDVANGASPGINEQANSDSRMNTLIQQYLGDALGCGQALFMYYTLQGGTGNPYAIYNDFAVPTQKSAAINTVAATPLANFNTCPTAISNKPFLATSQLGVNISNVCDWCGDSTFVDIMKQARGFASVNTPWDPLNAPAQVDANGWPTQDFGVVFTSWAWDPLGLPLTTTNPSFFGTYTLSFTGQANLSSNGSKQIINQVYNAQTNTTTAQLVIDATNGQIDLEFSNTRRTPGSGVNSGLQNIQLLRPGYPLGSTQVFTTQFLNALTPFSTIRMTDFLLTNGSPVTSWAQRTPLTMPSQQLNTTGGTGYYAVNSGVAWEYVIQLANLTGKDIWINIPEGVDLTDPTPNNYVVQLAQLLKASLNTNIHVYVEYSNETWNGQFSQTNANIAAAQSDVSSGVDPSLNFDNINNKWYWGFRRALHQTVRIGQLFAEIYGQSAINTTIRPVYMSQYVQPYIIEDGLNYLQQNFGAPSNYLYAVGSAPYFNLPNSYTDVNSFFASLTAGLNQVLPGFSGLTAYSGRFPVYSGITYQNIANYYGLKNFSYAGGPIVNQGPNPGVKEQANSDVRMNTLIQQYLADALGCGQNLLIFSSLQGSTSNPFAIYNDFTLPTQKSMAISTVAGTPLKNYGVCSASANNMLLVQ